MITVLSILRDSFKQRSIVERPSDLGFLSIALKPRNSMSAFLCKCLLGLLLCSALHGQLITEDFENYESGQYIVGQGAWQGTALGKHPANLIVEVEREGQLQKVLKGDGAGDRRDLFIPNKEDWALVVQGPVVTIRFLAKIGSGSSGVQVGPGKVAKYKLELPVFVTFGTHLSLRKSDGSQVMGLSKLELEKWYEVCLILDLGSGGAMDASATVAYRELGSSENAFQVDPALNAVSVDLSAMPVHEWNGLSIRQDGGPMMDQLRIESLDGIESLNLVEGEVGAMPFEPILDHIAAPREAVSLGGIWQVVRDSVVDGQTPPSAGANWQKVLVPDQHRSLFSETNGKRIWFKRSFDVPLQWEDDRVWLCLERVTDVGRVYINGQFAGIANNAQWPSRIDVTAFVRWGQSNELTVGVLSPGDSGAATNAPIGWPWFYSSFAGIPFPVHLERHNAVWISDVFVQPHLQERAFLETEVTITNDSDRAREVRLKGVVLDAFSHTAQSVSVPSQSSVTVTLRDNWESPHLWWPHDPYLYDLNIELVEETAGQSVLLDGYRQRFGFREFRVDGKRILLNERPFIHRRSSLIVYWQRCQESWLRDYFQDLRQKGYIGARLHGGASARVLRVADEMGMLITPETGVNEPRGHQVDEDFWDTAEENVINMVRLMRNHPSVAYWSLSNEFGSNYMPADDPKAPWVDQWLQALGDQVEAMDPGRTVTYSGDIDLGGRGQHGPASTMSLHYAWQPFQAKNMMPGTAYWLTEGLKPWQGVAWEQDKPLILSEDLYAPYSFKPPHGMTHWAGDAAYDFEGDGQDRAWFDLYRLMADGYYYAGISGWNPWGVPDDIFRFGQLMPDYWIAVTPQDRAFDSGEFVPRKIHLYNELFRDLDAKLERELWIGDTLVEQQTITVDLTAGAHQEVDVALSLPVVTEPTDALWKLTLRTEAEVLVQREFDYTVFPAPVPVAAEGRTALVVNGEVAQHLFDESSFEGGIYSSVEEALAGQAEALVIAGVRLTADEGAAVSAAVEQGLRVLWLEVPVGSWLPTPLQMNEQHRAARAFLRSPNDPVMLGLKERDLWEWGADSVVSEFALFKPSRGDFDILIDSGGPNGLNTAALLRLNRGSGSFLICQMKVLSKGDEAPALALLQRLVQSMAAEADTAAARSLVLAEASDGRLATRLAALQVPHLSAMSDIEGLLMVDGSDSLSNEVIGRIQAYLAAGNDVWLDELSDFAARQIASALQIEIEVASTETTRAIQVGEDVLLDGLSNDDWFWTQGGKDSSSMFSGILSGDSSWKFMSEPAGLAVRNVGPGRLIVSELRWSDPEMVSNKPDRSPRMILTLLKNLDVDLGVQPFLPREWTSLGFASVANRGFFSDPEIIDSPAAWFDHGEDDMRYFPINHTNLDPLNGVPAPPEEFPRHSVYASVPFELVDPLAHEGHSVLVMGGEGLLNEATISVDGLLGERVWMLGALETVNRRIEPVINVSWNYHDGSQAISAVTSGEDVNGYQYFQTLSNGRLAWSGDNGQRTGAVLYVWDVENPHPNRIIDSIHLETQNGRSIALVGMTLESVGGN